MRSVIYLIVAAIIAGQPLLATADDTNTTDISLHGTLIVPPPCTINDGETKVVDFKQVGTGRVNGENFKQRITYQIKCEDDANNQPWVMGLSVSGTPTSFDEAAIQAQITGSDSQDLGIKMLIGGKDFPLNKWVDISGAPLHHPTLEAVPVMTPGATLPEGDFHATATLTASYQ